MVKTSGLQLFAHLNGKNETELTRTWEQIRKLQVADNGKMFRIDWPCEREKYENNENKTFPIICVSFTLLQLLSVEAERWWTVLHGQEGGADHRLLLGDRP